MHLVKHVEWFMRFGDLAWSTGRPPTGKNMTVSGTLLIAFLHLAAFPLHCINSCLYIA